MNEVSLFTFEHEQVLAGAISGLVLSALLRNRAVATLVATAIAGALVWAIVAEPEGPTALFEAGATRLSQLATHGFLTGMLLAKAGVSIVHSLAGGGRGGQR